MGAIELLQPAAIEIRDPEGEGSSIKSEKALQGYTKSLQLFIVNPIQLSCKLFK